jgi:hypothetical protein
MKKESPNSNCNLSDFLKVINYGEVFLKKNIIIRIGLIPSTVIFSLIAIIVSVLITIVLFYFSNIEIIFRYVILGVIVPLLVAPPIIIFYGKLLVKIAKAEEHLRIRTVKLEKALDEIKQLSGLLPICASCKKIRDDKGYWNQIEAYISQHSEAQFSHSVCPECTQKLYPDIELYNDMRFHE